MADKGIKLLKDCNIFQLVEATEKVKGKEYARYIIKHPGASVIVPFFQGKLVMVKQFRFGAERICLEFPAGTLDSQENFLDCALRELQEETGLIASNLVEVGGFFTTPGFCNEFITAFFTKEFKEKSIQRLDDSEDIDIVNLSIDQVRYKIKTNEIQDGKTIIAFYLCDLKGLFD